MDQHILTFGTGKRTCLGKNIAMLETHKLVPAILMRYEIRLAEPEKEWRVRNSWIVRQEGVNVFLSRRTDAAKTGEQ
jgi:cytochrome P450